MKKIIILTSLLLLARFTSAQKYERDTICSKETCIKEEIISIKVDNRLVDSTYKYKATICKTRSLIGMGFGTGISVYNYNKKTAEWLGQHITGNFFDGGLYAELGVTVEQSFIRGSVFEGNITEKYNLYEDYSYDPSKDLRNLLTGNFVTINIEPKIGYAIPLQRSNLSFFASFNKSLYGIAIENYQSAFTRRIINFGISMHFFS